MIYYKWLFWTEGMDYCPVMPMEEGVLSISEKASKSLEKVLEGVSEERREEIAWEFFQHVVTLNEIFNHNDVLYHDSLLHLLHRYGYLTFKKSTESTVKCRMIPKRHNVVFADTKGIFKFKMSFRTYREIQENTCNSFSRIYRSLSR